ncbi:hypothetical protein CROQUDRAFT_664170 [Cronartium quercuum f. sp. fusiforme G11]|uniref:Uncharacterized protein n=1 Tax=Cronartium quercuum f. sp. fusiforme G11 TaxID=708437 RepID=A0A9P6T744_9BASI|nr:hypothetical protein CROQUDRAFT_664170 [Cronartium quercuum f. sp. fusiforme G11]
MASLHRKVPTLDEIVANLPPTINPFRFGPDLINQLRFPIVSSQTYLVLILFSIFHLLISLICILIVLRLTWPNSIKQKVKFSWIFKKVYVEDENGDQVETTPLILPNSGLLMAFFQFLASLVAQIQIYFTFFSFKSYKFASKFSLPVWLYISWLFAFYAFWVMTWASVYTRLYTQSAYAEALRSAPFYIFRPIVLNSFFVLIAVLVTFTDLFLISWNLVCFRQEKNYWADLLESMSVAAVGWDNLNSTTDASAALRGGLNTNNRTIIDSLSLLKGQVQDTMVKGYRVLAIDIQLIHRSRVIAFIWALILLFTCMIYAGVMKSLISLIDSASAKKGRRKPKVQVGLIRRPFPSQTCFDHPILDETEERSFVDTVEEASVLQRGLHYLICHSLVMILAILYATAICIIMGVKAEEMILNSYWRGLGSWLSLVGGIFMAIAMAFQFWRIWVDLDIIIPVQDRRDQSPIQYSPSEIKLGHR